VKRQWLTHSTGFITFDDMTSLPWECSEGSKGSLTVPPAESENTGAKE